MQTRSLRLIWSAVSIWLLACGTGPEPTNRAHPNLLLLTVDTLRSDHLSGYGYARRTSPALDQFFETAVVFDDAHANSSWTLPSLASLLTALPPSAHGCINHKSRLDPAFRTLAETLHEAGYATHGIASHTFLREVYGLQQGFDSFDDELALNLRMSHLATSSPQVTQKVVDWLGKQSLEAESNRPWFLWAHYFDPHYVYVDRPDTAPGLGTEPGSDQSIDLYDGEIAFTDRQLGIVFERLDELGLADSTVVVFTSDHGEAFGEHGHDQHGSNLFREVTQVPLAIRAPGFESRRVGGATSGVDVVPTVLDLLGVEPENGASERVEQKGPPFGRSLVDAMRGQPLDNSPLLLETELGRAFHAQAVIEGRWKLIADRTGGMTGSETDAPTLRPRGSEPAEPAWFLFDRESDPNDRIDVSRAHPDITMRLQVELERLLAKAVPDAKPLGDNARADLSDEEIGSLRALGYIDGAAGPLTPAGSSNPVVAPESQPTNGH